jgi:hypothetical protein
VEGSDAVLVGLVDVECTSGEQRAECIDEAAATGLVHRATMLLLDTPARTIPTRDHDRDRINSAQHFEEADGVKAPTRFMIGEAMQ